MNLQDLTSAQFSDLAKHVAAALVNTPWLARKAWPSVVVVIAPDEPPTAIARSTFVGWALSHDLSTLAVEARKRKVPPNHVLVFFHADEDDGAGAELGVFPLYSAIKDHWRDSAAE